VGRNAFVRLVTLVLAFIHAFPAVKHLRIFLTDPTPAEAWKGFGAVLAVALYLLPPSWQAHALGALWRRRRRVLVAGGWALALVHVVPAADHLPAFVIAPAWADFWRGVGAACAVIWFVLPIHVQAHALRFAHGWSKHIAARELARKPMHRALPE